MVVTEMIDDDKPIGYDTLAEALAVIAAHERAKQLERRSDREKLCLPNSSSPRALDPSWTQRQRIRQDAR